MSPSTASWREPKTYTNALKLLETRRRVSRPTRIPTSNPLPRTLSNDQKEVLPTYRGTPSITGMKDWLAKLGYSDADIASLNIVHVAGTKGKGSTCAFTRSFLQQWKLKTGFPKKIGMYTSPDLTCIRERIQIDNSPISSTLFTEYFFEVWDRLFAGRESMVEQEDKQPRFLQLMALLAFHTFFQEGVEAAIFETHHGGEFDATNFAITPVVTGITSIGIDHVLQLGPTIENIAWHKAGIFKTGTPAFSVHQTRNIEHVLQDRASERGVDLQFVDVDQSLPYDNLALPADVQRLNCALALSIVNSFLKTKSPIQYNGLRDEDVRRGVAEFSWPGRFESIQAGTCKYYLDGAHNELSIEQAVSWFATVSGADKIGGAERRKRFSVLIYSHLSDERDGPGLLKALANALATHQCRLDCVIFTTYQERQDGILRPDKFLKVPKIVHNSFLEWQLNMWREMYPTTVTVCKNSIEEALACVKSISTQHGEVDVLVTGSLNVVGGALHLLRQVGERTV